ncbi:MAG: FISUMP domain-containing protein [Bacteroidota bacterium]
MKIEFGTYLDVRDGREYRTVKLKDGKEWFVENLDYDLAGTKKYSGPVNPNFEGTNYGRKYTHDQAIRSIPEGTHLPTSKEWVGMVERYVVFGPGESGPFPLRQDENDQDWKSYHILAEGGKVPLFLGPVNQRLILSFWKSDREAVVFYPIKAQFDLFNNIKTLPPLGYCYTLIDFNQIKGQPMFVRCIVD